MERVARQWRRVGPAFPEGRLEIADGRPADGEVHVVPWRPVTVLRGDRLRLRVAVVVPVVAAAVAQVDAADVRDVTLGPAGVPQHDEFLVVRTAGTYPHVQQHLPAGSADLLAEVTVLVGAEAESVQCERHIRPRTSTPRRHASARMCPMLAVSAPSR